MEPTVDEGLWDYELRRAAATRLKGVVAILLGLVVLGGGVAFAWALVSVRSSPLRGLILPAVIGGSTVVAGGGMVLSAQRRIARVKRERRDAADG